MKLSSGAIIGICSIAACVNAQTLLEAISTYPQLSNFTALMTDNPNLAQALLTSNYSSLTGPATILVPDNSAFNKLSALYRTSMSNLTIQQLEPYLEYHLLVGQVTSDNLTAANGITVPTYLTGQQFNNRSAGDALGSTGANGDVHNGQVVFLQAKQSPSQNSTKRFVVRQLENPTVNAQGGLGHMINLTAVDGVWDGGYFQIVDKFLSLPLNCTDSIRRWNMTAFRGSLDRTGLGTPLDQTQNVTCFTPNDQAFLQAGSPNVTGSITDLQNLVKFHIIRQPLYSNFLEDGQMFETFSNELVRVSIIDGDIYMNDAKIINKNVMTNNGLMHVLDRVMSPLNMSSVSTSSATPTTTSAAGPLDTAAPSTVTVTMAPSSSAGTSSAALQAEPVSWLWTALAILGGILA